MTTYKVINALLKNKDGEWISPYTADTLKKNQITNCITEIPQKIKLELNNGILTLKAGSIVTVPNGFEADGITPKFNYMTITKDKYCGGVSTEGVGKLTLCCNTDGDIIDRFGHASGSTPSGDAIFYYDTINNIVTDRLSSREVSFPICSVTVTTVDEGVAITSIDEVYNGFGYIGQCTFVDKGVKALLPNGRNEDGTLKNIETVTTAITVTDLSNQTSILSFFDGSRFLGYGVDNYIVSDDKPTISTTHAMWYCPIENFVYLTNNGGANWRVTERIYTGLLTKSDATSSITSMDTRKPFRAVDYSDLEEIGQGGTGFYKLNNGLIVQWGSVSVGASSSVVVTLPTPFSSTNYMALTSMYSNSTSGSEKNWQTSTLTTTSFKAHNGQGGTCKFGWIAVGI